MSPRDGSNVYHRPPGTDAVPDTTIESTKYNTSIADVEQDLNTPRPIVAGGTGANNATDAMTSLQGDKAYQVVTNYDSYPFISGSFYSAAGATSAPTGNAFIGICYTSDPAVTPPAVPAGQNMFVEARDTTTNLMWLRKKTAGVWGAWAQQAGSNAALDAAYVNVAGDTMTGALTIGTGVGAPSLTFNSGATGSNGGYFGFQKAAANKWFIGQSSVILGSTSDNFLFYSFGGIGSALEINYTSGAVFLSSTTASTSPSTGALTVAGGVGVGGGLNTGSDLTVGGAIRSSSFMMSGIAGAGGTYYFGNAAAAYLTYDGNTFNAVGGPFKVSSATASTSYSTGALTVAGGVGITGALNVGSNMSVGNAGTNGTYYFGNTGTKYLTYDGTQFQLSGGWFKVGSGGSFAGVNASLKITHAGSNTEYGISIRPGLDNTTLLYFVNSADTGVGSITQTPSSVAYNVSSSAELKEDLKSFDAGNIIDSTNVYDFKWKASSERAYGVIAQQAVEVYPTAVTHTINPQNKDDEFWGVDYSRYVPVLLQELKALRARVLELEGRTAAKPA